MHSGSASALCLQKSPPPVILGVNFSGEARIVDSVFTSGNPLHALAGIMPSQAPQITSPWPQSYDPAHHWLLSAMVAALPLVVLLVAMAGLRIKGHLAALAGLATALTIALGVFHMPARLALLATGLGAGYGLFLFCWIVFPVLFRYHLTVRSGRFTLLQECMIGITEDSRLQLLLIAFALGTFFEGAGGFGTPVAVCGTILIGLGFRPLHAAGLALLANTAPVAFGSIGIPIIALHGVTGLDTLLLVSSLHGPWLVDLAASSISICALIGFIRVWKPKRILDPGLRDITHNSRRARTGPDGMVLRAAAPWIILMLCVVLWGTPRLTQWIDAATSVRIPVAGLHQMVLRMPPAVPAPAAEAAIFNLNWLSATGTGIFVAAVLAGLFMGLRPRAIAHTFWHTVVAIRFTLVTIAALMAIGFITRYCGMDATLGLAFARTGVFYPFFGTLIGWLGTASTGSDTSSNVLFGSLQKLTAQQLGISPYLMTSANSTGGVMGKMVAPQSIVVATTATETYGSEGNLLRFVLLHSIALACLMGLMVSLLAYWPALNRLVLR